MNVIADVTPEANGDVVILGRMVLQLSRAGAETAGHCCETWPSLILGSTHHANFRMQVVAATSRAHEKKQAVKVGNGFFVRHSSLPCCDAVPVVEICCFAGYTGGAEQF
jgi:hypothetical protein